MIIASAGHVDHGKTELIRALTGVDTDRLPEEKARGLSIDLGFAYQLAPDGKVIGFIDVPGHEKFIRNMLAGVGGIDLGLLVVAADDGVMPQTREHTAILDLLGIEACLVAVTKVDMVSQERVAEVRAEIRALLEGTRFADALMYEVCAPRGQGIAELRSAIDDALARFVARSDEGQFRLAVDRCFSLKGIGLVVTGTVFSGEVRADEQLVVSPSGLSARVRGIRAHDQVAEVARAGDRCALNIAGRGISDSSVLRGDWIVHESLHAPTDRIDIVLKVLASEKKSVKHWTPVHVHHGASHLTGRLAVLEGGSIEPGAHGRVQLVLEQAASAHWGDRLVVRDQSARRTLGGGYVIDPFSPKRGRARPARIEWLEAMSSADHGDALESTAAVSSSGVRVDQFRRARNVHPDALERVIAQRGLVRTGRGSDGFVFSPKVWWALQEAAVKFVAEYHAQHADLLGPNAKEIRFGVGSRIGDDIVDQLLKELLDESRLSRRAQLFHLPEHSVRLSPKDEQLWQRVEPKLSMTAGSPPSLQQAAEALSLEKSELESFMKRSVKAGWVVQIARNRYISTETMDHLTGVLENLAASRPEGFTAGEYRDACGLGRNFVIDLLEYYDRIGTSDRFGNVRRLRRSRSNRSE